MRCPYCGHDETQVVETRDSDEGGVVRRRRRCQHCEKRFTTYERPEIAMPAVVKKDGARVDFDPAKLRASMLLALRKR
ncbi:MAG TPA: transcriptional regulator NrdR, partial [Rubrivivax sp.]|nr:transcriptional regulator NrdR [Rubrivivax sp.]